MDWTMNAEQAANFKALRRYVATRLAAISWYCDRDSRRMNTEWNAYSNANPDADYWEWHHSYSKQFTKNPSIIKEWFKAKKEKVCPIITIE